MEKVIYGHSYQKEGTGAKANLICDLLYKVSKNTETEVDFVPLQNSEAEALAYLIGMLPIFTPRVLTEMTDLNIDRKALMTYLNRLTKRGIIKASSIPFGRISKKYYSLKNKAKLTYSVIKDKEDFCVFQTYLTKYGMFEVAIQLSQFQLSILRMQWDVQMKYLIYRDERASVLGEEYAKQTETAPKAVINVRGRHTNSFMYISFISSYFRKESIVKELFNQYSYMTPKNSERNDAGKNIRQIRVFVCYVPGVSIPMCFQPALIRKMIAEMLDDRTTLSQFKTGTYSEVYEQFVELASGSNTDEWNRRDLKAYLAALEKGQNAWYKKYLVDQQEIAKRRTYQLLVMTMVFELEAIIQGKISPDQPGGMVERFLNEDISVVCTSIGRTEEQLSWLYMDSFQNRCKELNMWLHKYFDKHRYSGRFKTIPVKLGGKESRLKLRFSRNYNVANNISIWLLFCDIDLLELVKAYTVLRIHSCGKLHDEDEPLRLVSLFETGGSFDKFIKMAEENFKIEYEYSKEWTNEISGFGVYIKDQDRFYMLKGKNTFLKYARSNPDSR